MEDSETGVLTKTQTRNQKRRIRSYRTIALTPVMSKWYASCIVFRLEKKTDSWKKLHVAEIDGIRCQHFQVLMTNLLQKPCEWQEDRRPMIEHASVIRPTMHLASLDIKTAFDVARPKAHCTINGGSHCPWMDYCRPFT